MPCSWSTGYAVGADIGFPDLDPAFQTLPANADPSFKPFWGRWEGDDEEGNYIILEAVDVRLESIFLRIGISDGPGRGGPFPRIARDLGFQLDGGRTRIYHMLFDGRPDILAVKFKSESELEFTGHSSVRGRVRKLGIRLHKRIGVDSRR